MSTPNPFPTETEEQVQGAGLQGAWNPWQGPAKPGFWSGTGFSEDNPLGPLESMAVKPLGQATAAGEVLLAGAAHRVNAFGAEHLGNVPILGSILKDQEQRSAVLEHDAAQRIKALTPDPTTTGAAVQTISGLVSGGYRAALGTVLGGPAGGAALLGSTEAATRYQALREQGVASGTAAESAGVSGATSAAGALIPGGIGASLFSKIATGAGANVLLGTGARYADHKILEAGGYKEMADQERVWDGVGMLTDALLGGAFGGLAHLHTAAAAGRATDGAASVLDQAGARDAALTAHLAVADRQTAPGVPIDPASQSAHQAALQSAVTSLLTGEPVDVAHTGIQDAAMLARPEDPSAELGRQVIAQAFRNAGVPEAEGRLADLEAAMASRMNGEKAPAESVQAPAQSAGAPIAPAEIPRAEESALSPEDRNIESRFAEQLARDPDAAERAYAQIEETQGGKILNTDTARELSPDYLADRTKSAAVHEPASWLVKRMYARKLQEQPGPGEEPLVLFTAGGTGAGKSTAVKNALGDIVDRAQIVMDTNMNGEESSIRKIDQATGAGKDVMVSYVHREPVEALTHGALTRAMKQEAKHGSGRTVPIEEHVNTHVGANEAIRHIVAHYEADPRVTVHIIDNTRGPKGSKLIELEKLPRLDYNKTREEASAALEEAHSAGRISPAVYRGFRGAEVEHPELPGEEQGLGAAAGRQPEPQRAGRRPDQLADSAQQALRADPNLEIAGSDGKPVSAAEALSQAQEQLTQISRDAPKAANAAVSCFLRRGAA